MCPEAHPDLCRVGVLDDSTPSENLYLPRSRTYDPGGYFELLVSPWGHVRCTWPGFTHRGMCKHAEALRVRLEKLAWFVRMPRTLLGATLFPSAEASCHSGARCWKMGTTACNR